MTLTDIPIRTVSGAHSNPSTPLISTTQSISAPTTQASTVAQTLTPARTDGATEAAPALSAPAASAEAFKGAMGAVPSPVSIVTAYWDGIPHGTTVGAFMSLSIEPAMVLISLQESSSLLDTLRHTKRFGLNVLCHQQRNIAAQFSKKGVDRWQGVNWTLVNDVPRIAGDASFVACSIFQVITAGDHVIFTGLVEHAENTEHAGLVYQHRTFGSFVAN